MIDPNSQLCSIMQVSVTHGHCFICRKIEQWRLPGDPARGCDIDAPGYELSKGQYFVGQWISTNEFFLVALFDLIICHTTKMGLLFPPLPPVPRSCRSQPRCHIRQEGFQDQGWQAREMACWRWYLSLPQVAHIQCCLQGPNCWAARIELVYWVLQRLAQNVSSQWRTYPQKAEEAAGVLAGMPSTSRAKNIPAPTTKTITWQLPMGSMSSYSRFIMKTMMHDRQRMLHDRQQGLAMDLWWRWKLNKCSQIHLQWVG